MNFSDKIKFQREQNHLTQKELAELLPKRDREIITKQAGRTGGVRSERRRYGLACVGVA